MAHMSTPGAVAAVEPIVKQPAEVYPVNFELAPILPTGVTISSIDSVEVHKGTYRDRSSIEDETTEELAVDSFVPDGTLAQIWFSEGEHNQDYYVEVQVTCSDGSLREADFWVKCRDR